MFEETIQWDLGSPTTPTPLAFATQTAVEYGLTNGQTSDLILSIQAQINQFWEKSSKSSKYQQPYCVRDPFGKARPKIIVDTIAVRQQVQKTTPAEGSTRKQNPRNSTGRGRSSNKSGNTPATASRSGRLLNRTPGPAMGSSRTTLTSISKRKGPEMAKIKFEYYEEVKRRLKLEYIDMYCHSVDNGAKVVPPPEYVTNLACHICHSRKPEGVKFCCQNHSHVYCAKHLSERLNLAIKDAKNGTLDLNYCPICCLVCVCAKCQRKVESVTHEFVHESVKQNIIPSVNVAAKHTNGSEIENRPVNDSENSTNAVVSIGDHATKFELSRVNIKLLQYAMGKKATSDRVMITHSEETVIDKDPDPVNSSRNMQQDNIKELDTPSRDESNQKGIRQDQTAADSLSLVGSLIEGTQSKRGPRRPRCLGEKEGKNEEQENDEDSNIDYCFKCRRNGDIVCCDRCPRAFHIDCLPEGKISDDDWICHLCIRDDNVQESDVVTGKDSLDLITAAFVNFQYVPGFTEKISLICKIHEMVKKLICSDFGYVFQNPVSLDEFKDYSKVVVKPMDLSSVGSNIVNGVYAGNVQGKASSEFWNASQGVGFTRLQSGIGPPTPMDEVIFLALRDIESIWQNCYKFNRGNIQIGRMTQVQRRICQKIISCSFEGDLHPVVKEKLTEYEDVCKKELSSKVEVDIEGSSNPGCSIVNTVRCEASQPSAVPMMESTYKDQLKKPTAAEKKGLQRPVVVIDPKTNRVLKHYKSLKSAVEAVFFMMNSRNLKPEFQLSDSSVKEYIEGKCIDPRKFLFGFRWLFKEAHITELSPQISTPEITTKNGSKIHSSWTKSSVTLKGALLPEFYLERFGSDLGQHTFVSTSDAYFVTVKEHPSFEREFPFKKFEKFIQNSIMNVPAEIKEGFIPRLTWRKVSAENCLEENLCVNGKLIERCNIKNDGSIPTRIISFDLPDNDFFKSDRISPTLSDSILVVKEDLISGGLLAGFETIENAYQDWLDCRKCALKTPDDACTIDVFEIQYLKGSRNIDGIEWKLINANDSPVCSTALQFPTPMNTTRVEEENDACESGTAHTIPQHYLVAQHDINSCSVLGSSEHVKSTNNSFIDKLESRPQTSATVHEMKKDPHKEKLEVFIGKSAHDSKEGMFNMKHDEIVLPTTSFGIEASNT
mmetsp:Transcript_13152/g.16037  ORF Transcript_13152/g.16037 Transcript_13152/m.16037 type:complete len:1168 (+) Transcript_13152:1384-4887(+)